MTIDYSGNIGIGTTSPGQNCRFRVRQGAATIVSVYGDNGLQHGINVGTSGTDRWSIFQDGDNGLGFYGDHSGDGSSTSYAMKILQNGYVGVGTGAPASKLTVADAALPSIASYYTGASAAGNKGMLAFYHNRNSDSTQELLAMFKAWLKTIRVPAASIRRSNWIGC